MINVEDELRLRRAIELARQAAKAGDRPHGAVLTAVDGSLAAEGRNKVVSARDLTAHAEMSAVRAADPALLAGSTMYASSEPCVMCAGALVWAGVARVVFGASIPRVREALEGPRAIEVRCAAVLAACRRPIEVVGPVLEEEAVSVFTA